MPGEGGDFLFRHTAPERCSQTATAFFFREAFNHFTHHGKCQFQNRKQDTLNRMDFADMGDLRGTLGNKEVRQWHKYHDEHIPDLLDTSKSLEEQARQACELRNTHRTQARELMKDQKLRKQLDETDPNKSFEELLADKMQCKNLTREQAVQDILNTATKTRKSVNKALGLE